MLSSARQTSRVLLDFEFQSNISMYIVFVCKGDRLIFKFIYSDYHGVALQTLQLCIKYQDFVLLLIISRGNQPIPRSPCILYRVQGTFFYSLLIMLESECYRVMQHRQVSKLIRYIKIMNCISCGQKLLCVIHFIPQSCL